MGQVRSQLIDLLEQDFKGYAAQATVELIFESRGPGWIIPIILSKGQDRLITRVTCTNEFLQVASCTAINHELIQGSPLEAKLTQLDEELRDTPTTRVLAFLYTQASGALATQLALRKPLPLQPFSKGAQA